MPLPIGDATATPGSPIIGPEDSHIGFVSGDRPLGEQASQDNAGITNTAVDDEETLDELEPYTSSGVGRAVPTFIEWNGPGEKVYVTGTFVNWEKKYRLHRKYVTPPHLLLRLNLSSLCMGLRNHHEGQTTSFIVFVFHRSPLLSRPPVQHATSGCLDQQDDATSANR
jgi:hypothetical protein